MRQENTLCKMLTTRHATRTHPVNPGDPYPHEMHTRVDQLNVYQPWPLTRYFGAYKDSLVFAVQL